MARRHAVADNVTVSTSHTTCVVADDHPPILDCLARYLASAGYEVVGTAADGEGAFTLAAALQPDVCIADVRMPKLDGLQLARKLADFAPAVGVLLYSGASDAGLASEALGSGARGFALKDAPLDDLERAVDMVAAGGIYIDPVLAATIASSHSRDSHAALSTRELEVLRLLAGGDSYAEIGSMLFLSPDTVRTHAQRAMTKLGARTRTQAVAVALRDSLIA
jgi:DNA-binding NarL/FixJ family response regulator